MAIRLDQDVELIEVGSYREDDTPCSVSHQSLINQDISKSSNNSEEDIPDEGKLRILVVGETGVGKSTLINSFLSEKIDKKAKVTHGAIPTSHEPIERHEGRIGPNKVIIYDTKGLIDADPSSKDSKLMKEFRAAIREDKIDLVFICQRMFGRLNESTVHIVEMIAKYFKKRDDYIHIWERCILILTQANTYDFEDDDDKDNEDDAIKMTKVMRAWGQTYKEALQKYKVPDAIADNIPVCAAGNKRKLSLPITNNWIYDLYDVCSLRCPPDIQYVVMNLKHLRKDSLSYSIKGGAAAGAAIGAILIPGLGAAPGVTIGLLIGWGLGVKTLKDMEEKMVENAKQKQLRMQTDL